MRLPNTRVFCRGAHTGLPWTHHLPSNARGLSIYQKPRDTHERRLPGQTVTGSLGRGPYKRQPYRPSLHFFVTLCLEITYIRYASTHLRHEASVSPPAHPARPCGQRRLPHGTPRTRHPAPRHTDGCHARRHTAAAARHSCRRGALARQHRTHRGRGRQHGGGRRGRPLATRTLAQAARQRHFQPHPGGHLRVRPHGRLRPLHVQRTAVHAARQQHEARHGHHGTERAGHAARVSHHLWAAGLAGRQSVAGLTLRARWLRPTARRRRPARPHRLAPGTRHQGTGRQGGDGPQHEGRHTHGLGMVLGRRRSAHHAAALRQPRPLCPGTAAGAGRGRHRLRRHGERGHDAP